MLLRDAMVLYSCLLADKPLRFPVFCSRLRCSTDAAMWLKVPLWRRVRRDSLLCSLEEAARLDGRARSCGSMVTPGPDARMLCFILLAGCRRACWPSH